MLRRPWQFDTLGIAAATLVVATVVAIGRQFYDAGVVLAGLLLPACLILAVGSRRTQSRTRLGLVSLLTPVFGILVGVAVQTLVWGALLRLTWIPIVAIAMSTLIALLLIWNSATRKCVLSIICLAFVCTLGWVTYQLYATSSERWVAAKFLASSTSSNAQVGGRVRIFSKFDAPGGRRQDPRQVEGPTWRMVQRLRLLLGLSSAVSLQVAQPLRNEEWEKVSQLKHLQRLDVSGMVIDDRILEALSQLEALEQISFADCEISASLKPLSKASSLKGLLLSGVSVHDFQGLAELKNLEGIIIGNTRIDLSLAQAIVQLPNLDSLHVYGEQLSDRQFDCIMLRVLIDQKKREPSWLQRCSVGVSCSDVPTLVEYYRQFAIPGVPLLDGLPADKIQAVQTELDRADGFIQASPDEEVEEE